jgi:HPt (histidine-containing phosphotransfer) domain-containing protein
LVELVAHSVKGSSANIAAGQMQKIAFAIEQAGKSGDFGKAGILFQELEREFEVLTQIMI